MKTMTAFDFARAVETFASVNPELSTRRGARGKCYGTSFRFIASVVEEFGSEAPDLRVIQADGEYGSHKYLPLYTFVNHFAVLMIDGKFRHTVVDFTAAQFGDHYDSPWVCPEVEWRSVMTEQLKYSAGSTRVDFSYERLLITSIPRGSIRHDAHSTA